MTFPTPHKGSRFYFQETKKWLFLYHPSSPPLTSDKLFVILSPCTNRSGLLSCFTMFKQDHSKFIKYFLKRNRYFFIFTTNCNMLYKDRRSLKDSKESCLFIVKMQLHKWLVVVLQGYTGTATALRLLVMEKLSYFCTPFNMFCYLSQKNGHSVDVLGMSKAKMLDSHVHLLSNRRNMEMGA